VDQLRARLEDYVAEMGAAIFEFRAGHSTVLDVERIEDRFDDIVDPAGALTRARREAEAATGSSVGDAWWRLASAFGAIALDRATRPLSRPLSEREAATRVTLDGDEMTLFAGRGRLAREPDPDRRHRLEDVLAAAEEGLVERREELFVRTGETLAELGFDSVRAWCSWRLGGLDHDHWRDQATHFLEATEASYAGRRRELLMAIGVDERATRRSDFGRAIALAEHDPLFPAGKLRDAAVSIIGGLGIDLARIPGLRIDDEDRPGKNPRACCIGVRVPDDVRVIVTARSGLAAYDALLHELGHGLHHAFTSPALPAERRLRMDSALTEAWAMLLQYRVTDPAWLAIGPTSARSDAIAHDARSRRLMMLRRFAGKLRWELELATLNPGSTPRPLAELYEDEMTRATGFPHRAGAYLADTDPLLESFQYFRAWCLEAALAEHLRDRHGRDFWRAKGTGDLLKELWNTGGTYSADELSAELGLGELTVEPLLRELG